MVIKILIASTNPVKVQAVRDAFSSFYPDTLYGTLELQEADSGGILKSQPIGEDETRVLSRKRVFYARECKPEFDFFVGIEGGVVLTLQNQPRIVVYSSVGTDSFIETIRGCEIPLPKHWFQRLADTPQLELGDLMTEISGVVNIKQKSGAVGYLTRNIVRRVDILRQSVIMALIPFLNADVFRISV